MCAYNLRKGVKIYMKKSLLCLLPALLVSSLMSCDTTPSKVHLIYGSLIDTAPIQLTYDEFKNMVDEEESFIIAMTPDCGCLGGFMLTLEYFVSNNPHVVYYIENTEFTNKDSFDLPISDSEPSFAIYDKGKATFIQVYEAETNSRIFLNVDSFTNYILGNTIAPIANYIDKATLDEKITNEEEFLIMYSRSTCPDCTYLNDYALKDYLLANAENLTDTLYLIDCDVEGIRLTNGEFNETQWVNFKNAYGLSNVNNRTYGFNEGYVPTIQYRKDGLVASQFVYLNDTIALNEDDEYYVQYSFFSEDRLPNLSYAQNVEINVIEGLVIPNEFINVQGTYFSWDRANARTYYDPLLEAFLAAFLH